ncbi:7534_t:CDS:2 [Paraglomus occultum]|uniref:7534_t:CDS:1 n=1 Tax=Paraglomus occultum TaxID=144539 RepID=A0A9N8ZQH4_9GLOM|nr:7534_t:CDS:2 [Paraglomus occultum]
MSSPSSSDSQRLIPKIENAADYGTFRSESKVESDFLESNISTADIEISAGAWTKRSSKINSPTTLVLLNKASTARDCLSIERTFLSWLRLSTALTLTGLAVFFRFALVPVTVSGDSLSIPLGLALIVLGIFTLFWALYQYFNFQYLIATSAPIVQNGKCNFSVALLVGLSIVTTLLISFPLEVSRRNRPHIGEGDGIQGFFI